MADTSRHVTVRRADRPGDLGWVVTGHGEGYDQQAHHSFGHDPVGQHRSLDL